MTLTVTGRHLVVPEPARAQIARKMAHLEHLLGSSALSAQCVVSRERQQYILEATVHTRGAHQLHAIAKHGRLATAVSSAADKLEQQAHKLSDRWKTRKKTGGARRLPEDDADLETAPDGALLPRVIRARHPIRPMTVDDAVLALHGSRDALIVFRQMPSDGVSVLYRRPDGHFGLIESEA
jgi:putative sigma-54 modulation protein